MSLLSKREMHSAPSLNASARASLSHACGINLLSKQFLSAARNNTKTNSKNIEQDSGVINYFEILDIPAKFDIDLDLIHTRFHSKMLLYHPDIHSNDSKEMQAQAELMSSRVNMAKTVLESPLWRAKHLLQLTDLKQNNIGLETNSMNGLNRSNGEFLNGAAKSTIDSEEEMKIDDIEFLSEIMETRLQVESASQRYVKIVNQLNEMEKGKDDDATFTKVEKEVEDALNALYGLKRDNEAIMERMIEQMSNLFDGKESSELTAEQIDAIRESVAKLVYYWRIENQIKAILPAR